jgi:polar amino acid transport system substrate-binding protein
MMLAGSLAVGAGVAVTTSASAQAVKEGSTWKRIQDRKKLIVGGVANGAPYYSKDIRSGEWKGFYYELSKLLASDIGVDLEVYETVWGNGVLDIQSGKVDVMFGLSATPKRALSIDFTDPIFRSVVVALAKPSLKAATWADLNKPELTIAVDIGSSHEQAVGRMAPLANVLRFKSVEEATVAFQSGRADCQVLAVLLAMNARSKFPDIGTITLPTPVFGAESAGGLMREDDRTFRDFLNYFIRYHRSNGTIREMLLSNLSLLGLKPEDWPADIPV